jgi:HlyD family secretion protein
MKSASSNPGASIRRHALVALVATALVVGGAGGWASTTEIAGAVVAPGVLVVSSSIKKVQHPTGGVVGELNVRDGSRVKAGDVVIRLDPTVTQSNVDIIVKSLDELTARRARFEAEQDGRAGVAFPTSLTARSGDRDVARLVAGETKLFDVRRTARTGLKSQLKERVGQLREQIQGSTEQITAKDKEIALIGQELVGVRELWKKELVPVQRVMALDRDKARLEGERGALLSAVAQTKGKITETELQIIQIDQDLMTEVGKELADIRSKMAELAEKKVAADDQLKRIDIIAPQDGVVHQLAAHTVGGVIAAGEAAMMIVPESDVLEVESRIAPQDVDQVRFGQKAALRFSAFNQRSTPEIMGRVSMISADLSTDNRTGTSYYTVRLELPPEEVVRLGTVRLIPGMPVESFIETTPRTVLTYLTKPLTDQVMRAFREDH